MPKYVYGSIHPVGAVNEHMAFHQPLAFQGNIADKLLMPKKAQIPWLPNESTCAFPDGNMTIYIYNTADDKWYNSKDSSDVV